MKMPDFGSFSDEVSQELQASKRISQAWDSLCRGDITFGEFDAIAYLAGEDCYAKVVDRFNREKRDLADDGGDAA